MSVSVAVHTGVPPLVVAAVLAAAVLHATWNALAHAIADQLVAFTLIGAGYTAGGAALAALSSLPAAGAWPFLAASVLLHVGYTLLLMRGNTVGEFGQVYPLARGTAPLLVALAAAVFVGETLSPARLAGVLLVCAGIGLLVLAGGRLNTANRPALVAALATGVVIAAYTTVDGIGVRHAHGAAGYAGWLFALQGPVLPVVATVRRGSTLPRRLRPHLAGGLSGGLLSLVAYGLVLWAQTRGALAPIAALRETSVVLGAAIGALVFGERFGAQRIAAALLVAAGIVTLNL